MLKVIDSLRPESASYTAFYRGLDGFQYRVVKGLELGAQKGL
jgi:hypothetical protein